MGKIITKIFLIDRMVPPKRLTREEWASEMKTQDKEGVKTGGVLITEDKWKIMGYCTEPPEGSSRKSIWILSSSLL